MASKNEASKVEEEVLEEEVYEDDIELPETPEAEVELLLGYREFESPDGSFNLRVYKPTIGIEAKADAAYSRDFNTLLRSDDPPLTKRKMEKRLAEIGDWTEEDEEELIGIRNKAIELRRKVDDEKSKKKTSKKKLTELSSEFMDAQLAFYELNTVKNSYFNQTLEGMADEKRWMTKLVLCTKKVDDGQELPLWDSVEDLLNEEDITLARKVLYEATLFWQGVDTSLFDGLPGLVEDDGDED